MFILFVYLVSYVNRVSVGLMVGIDLCVLAWLVIGHYVLSCAYNCASCFIFKIAKLHCYDRLFIILPYYRLMGLLSMCALVCFKPRLYYAHIEGEFQNKTAPTKLNWNIFGSYMYVVINYQKGGD